MTISIAAFVFATFTVAESLTFAVIVLKLVLPTRLER
jgi:hypothetical protein